MSSGVAFVSELVLASASLSMSVLVSSLVSMFMIGVGVGVCMVIKVSKIIEQYLWRGAVPESSG